MYYYCNYLDNNIFYEIVLNTLWWKEQRSGSRVSKKTLFALESHNVDDDPNKTNDDDLWSKKIKTFFKYLFGC